MSRGVRRTCRGAMGAVLLAALGGCATLSAPPDLAARKPPAPHHRLGAVLPHSVDGDPQSGGALIDGYITNTWGFPAQRVRVLVTGHDGTGKPVGQVIAWGPERDQSRRSGILQRPGAGRRGELRRQHLLLGLGAGGPEPGPPIGGESHGGIQGSARRPRYLTELRHSPRRGHRAGRALRGASHGSLHVAAAPGARHDRVAAHPGAGRAADADAERGHGHASRSCSGGAARGAGFTAEWRAREGEPGRGRHPPRPLRGRGDRGPGRPGIRRAGLHR